MPSHSSWIFPSLLCAGVVLLRGLRDGQLMSHILYALVGGVLVSVVVVGVSLLLPGRDRG